MRYIGSKQRLLDAIVTLAREQRVERGGTVLDVFAGTSVVGRRFKEEGFRVVGNDRMWLSYVLQQALVVADEAPRDLHQRVRALEAAAPVDGLLTRHYSPAGPADRRFFVPERARAIDGAVALLRAWRASGEVTDSTFFLLLAGVLEGASALANISGTYGAFLKGWQVNAEAPFRVRVTPPCGPVGAPGRRCEAHCADANALVAQVPCDLLYIDPPYNGREYAANYHVLDILAEAALTEDEARRVDLERSIYGKTGLRPYTRSRYCSRPRVEAAFRALIRDAKANHIIVSYNEEGLLSREAIVDALAAGLGCAAGAVLHREVAQGRFRSDRDRDPEAAPGGDGARRQYRQLNGRSRDVVHEWLFHAARPATPTRDSHRGGWQAATREPLGQRSAPRGPTRTTPDSPIN